MPEDYEETKRRVWNEKLAEHELGIYLRRRRLIRGCQTILVIALILWGLLIWIAFHWPPR
jgi:hypothetical protein